MSVAARTTNGALLIGFAFVFCICYPTPVYSRSVDRVTVITGIWDVVSMCPRSKRKTAWAIDTKAATHIYSLAVARHALTRRSKGQKSRSYGYENRQGCMAASGCCGRGTARRTTA